MKFSTVNLRNFFRCFLVLMLLSVIGFYKGFGQSNKIDIRLSKANLLDKIKGGWAGQTIGVTYGWPTEFVYLGTYIQNYERIKWHDDYINQAMREFPGLFDDIYVDLTFLEVYHRLGIDAPIDSLASAFSRTEYELWHANQCARYNLRNGLPATASGHWRNNPHADDIDFQIEADFAGLLSPGMPNRATEICERVGKMISSGDGYYGGVMVANMYAWAFLEREIKTVIVNSLRAIPKKSNFYKCITDVLFWHEQYPDDWKKTWFEIQKKWAEDIGCPNGVFHPLNIEAKLNMAYVVMALLYGGHDFYKTMDIATRAGQDSDCNPSTACGILGTMIGFKNIPETWIIPLLKADTVKFSHSKYSLTDIYDVNMGLALENIESSGGRVSEDSVYINAGVIQEVEYVKNFKDHFPDLRVKIDKYSDNSFNFEFTGVGFVLGGHLVKLDKSVPDKPIVASLYIDGKKVEQANLYTNATDRRPELFWRYSLSDGNHKVEVRLDNSSGAYKLYISDYLTYKSKL
ncbi:ADP-ribosylglycohydrolase family protein [Sphingobacterium faecale]|uniref:ADP-ribosylglycohydrolase family protein n=1 Tax=Sphingobacterium faecale TaxID=2803775 RepID=A0ABS1R0Q7_9SPHI|nr:ADP-ribosylglycohydrolase family protein [Sphingobacterium faecale]MBL1408276.1 ADP-ribosylglycohydrolase family protein [Sphingobacterium faecale]